MSNSLSSRRIAPTANAPVTPKWAESIGLRSPLARRIALIVLLLFIAIDAVFLLWSFISERQRQLSSIDQTVTLLRPVLGTEPSSELFSALVSEPANQALYPLLGVQIERPGQTRSIGAMAGANANVVESPRATVDWKNQIYTVYDRYSRDGEGVGGVWYQFDIARLNANVLTHLLWVFCKTLVVGVLIALGCLLMVVPIIVKPLIVLRELMASTSQDGLASVRIPDSILRREDELGDVYAAFSRMRIALVDAERSNKVTTERFQDFADLGADFFWEIDADNRFAFVAGDLDALFGLPKNQVVGRTYRELCEETSLPLHIPAERLELSVADSDWEGEVELADDPDELKTMRVSTRAKRNDFGRVESVRGSIVDTTNATRMARELHHQATHDVLTGLVNRREFDRILGEALEHHSSTGVDYCVCLLDLDRFKIVNDNCGHAAGDKLLKQLADILLKTVRSDDVICRFGGDEFTVLLNGCELAFAIDIAERIRMAVGQHRFPWDGVTYDVGVSIGVVGLSDEFAQPSDVLRAVDACCFKAKQQGRNQVQRYSSDDRDLVQRHDEMQWMANMNKAIESQSFVLYQQAICSVRSAADDSSHIEVLLRMRHADGQIVTPGAFLPAAERFGLIDRIDRWVVTEVLQWLEQQVINPARDFVVCVNLSGISAADREFQEFLINAIEQSSISPNHLCFEITETSAMQNLLETIEFLQRLRDLGCRIALDDFGTGFSSLGYIKQLPLDYIKIDGAFIREIVSNPLDRALVKCVADVARILGIETIAEFVEDETTRSVLSELGIDKVQGYLYSTPGPLADYTLVGDRRAA